MADLMSRTFGLGYAAATMGDLLTKTPEKGGLGIGTIGSSAVLLTILFALIYWNMRREDAVAAGP